MLPRNERSNVVPFLEFKKNYIGYIGALLYVC
jgi:hypothetical protein